MSAQLEPTGPHAAPMMRLLPMTSDWLDAVHRVELAAYTHPWTRTNFNDSLAAGYHAQLLAADTDVVGYSRCARSTTCIC